MGSKCEGCGPGRREFISTVTGTALKIVVVAAVAPVVEACGDTTGSTGGGNSLSVDVSGLSQDGQALVTTSNGPDGAPVLVVRQSATSFAALSMVCTHAGCTLDDPSSNGVLFCPCHGSEFNLQGQVLRGPARASLSRLTAAFDATTDKLTITF